MDSILNRRSVRSYPGEPITGKKMALLLKAGFAAPSAMGSSSWHLISIQIGRLWTN
jgi:nitroreductase